MSARRKWDGLMNNVSNSDDKPCGSKVSLACCLVAVGMLGFASCRKPVVTTSKTAGNTSYFTLISFNACSAISAVSAATHATRSPTNRTFVSNINASYGEGSGYPCPAVVWGTRGTQWICARTVVGRGVVTNHLCE